MQQTERMEIYPTHNYHGYAVRLGRPFPFGATIVPGGVNFSIFSQHATRCVLLLFHPDHNEPMAEIPFHGEFEKIGQDGSDELELRIGNVFTMTVFNLNYEEEVKLHEFLNTKTGESSIVIGERTFIKVEVEGEEWVCEWFYTSIPNTHYPLVGVGLAENEQWDPTGEMVTQRDELNTEQAVIVGVDAAAEGSSDQTAHMPVKWDVPILKGDQIPDTQEDGHFLQEGRAAGDSGEEH